jgi:hypothetical protein
MYSPETGWAWAANGAASKVAARSALRKFISSLLNLSAYAFRAAGASTLDRVSGHSVDAT